MELTGKIQLDEESMKKLKEDIREEVLKDLEKDGLTWEETKRYIEDLKMTEYFQMVKLTIEGAIEKGKIQEENDEFHFDDEKKFRLLKMMQEMIKLSGIF